MKNKEKVVYRVTTQEEYDGLMKELEERGYTWLTNEKPRDRNYFQVIGGRLCICPLKDKKLSYDYESYFTSDDTPDYKIVSYVLETRPEFGKGVVENSTGYYFSDRKSPNTKLDMLHHIKRDWLNN